MIIAVDGPAAAGKGTIARALAQRLGLQFLDTGSLYRMVGLSLLRAGHDPSNTEAAIAAAHALNPLSFRDEDLRTEAVGGAASIIAVVPQVRRALLDFQRAFARRQPGAVLDGRDIGTVVCPEADVKLFITASPEVRAARRHKELGTGTLEDVLAEVRARDARDMSRADAPLKPAKDAVVIDTSDLDIAQAISQALDVVARTTDP